MHVIKAAFCPTLGGAYNIARSQNGDEEAPVASQAWLSAPALGQTQHLCPSPIRSGVLLRHLAARLALQTGAHGAPTCLHSAHEHLIRGWLPLRARSPRHGLSAMLWHNGK